METTSDRAGNVLQVLGIILTLAVAVGLGMVLLTGFVVAMEAAYNYFDHHKGTSSVVFLGCIRALLLASVLASPVVAGLGIIGIFCWVLIWMFGSPSKMGGRSGV